MSRKQLFNNNWYFLKTGLDWEYGQAMERLSDFQPVDIPHDWLIYNTENLYEDSMGWYCKRFTPEEFLTADFPSLEDGHAILRFDGVYMDSTVYVNGRKLAEWKYGYSTFDVDITEAMLSGENLLVVQVRHQAPNSRWYSGAGIYRNVWLCLCPAVYLTLDGTYVHTEKSENGYGVIVRTEVSGLEDSANNGASPVDLASLTVHYTLLWENGQMRELGSGKVRGMEAQLEAEVEHPLLWDVESPNLYRLKVDLTWENDRILDSQFVTIGFRTLEFTTDRGLFLNGKHLKLHGVCEHHDFGCLGAAFHKEALRRKFCMLRRMGVNAIRSSHNMPAPELMEMADEMGLLVLTESFDMWETPKTTYDYARYFKEWACRDVASWVRRDRNHPSLLLWSIGNEIYDTHASEHGQEITRRLSECARRHDPLGNAPVTVCSNYMAWENARKCADIVKLAGYNYGEKYYGEHHAKHPDWVIYGSETASMVQSRGVYHFPLAQSLLADEDEQCSALGNSTTSWGAKNAECCIAGDRDADYSLGQFIWTGFDYIGEPTPYHTKNSYFGQIDTAGFPKDSYYVFQAEWTDAGKAPMVHLFPYWDFNEGQLIDVRACTNGASVELFVNGVSQGRQHIDHRHGQKLLGDWQVPYRRGYIEAAAYDEEGREIARERRDSFGDSASLTLAADKDFLRADGEDLLFVSVGTKDSEGNPVENAMDYVNVTVEGEARLLGLDNGDSTDYDAYKGSSRKLFNGRLLAVLGTTCTPGEIRVTVRGKGLKEAELSLRSVEAPVRQGISAREDCSERKIGIGGLAAQAWRESLPVPVRKIALSAPEGRLLSPDQDQVTVEAKILPENASDTALIWKVVNDAGIEIGYASAEETGDCHRARVTAKGDGLFRVRCMSKSGREKTALISQLEFQAKGLGQAFLDPYGFISAGLYTELLGEVTNGNEKGVATARDGRSGVTFSGVDFGDYGSDVVTMPIFALSDDAYPMEIWLGRPDEGELLDTVVYQKPSRFNTYQEETWKLPRRLKGVCQLSFVLEAKVHIKGFSFLRYDKAFSRICAGECSQLYGDSFERAGDSVKGIGNNVTLVYENMDFGEAGAEWITIWGSTPLRQNTIHIHFTDEQGLTQNRMVEFAGGTMEGETAAAEDGACQTFAIERLCGRGRVELIFLPGSNFDLYAFRFEKGK